MQSLRTSWFMMVPGTARKTSSQPHYSYFPSPMMAPRLAIDEDAGWEDAADEEILPWERAWIDIGGEG